MTKTNLVDQWGMPIERTVLTQEIAAPTISGVRSPLTSYPGDGLNPQRLASILREADAGDPLRYLELAETIEERDLHYAGVIGTRKRSVSQLDINVQAASDDAAHQEHAAIIQDWLTRDELNGEMFDMLDAVGKGYSNTEIIWDTSTGQWQPGRLEWRDPRWFRPARHDLTTAMLINEHGQEVPLPPFKFIQCVMKAKSGLPIRSGIARIALWAWMMKAYTQRDWAIFTQTYGQPVRVGKYGPNATDEDKRVLLRAVTNIAGDCAAIIPESMALDFIESKNVGAGSDLYLKRSDWLDQQISKAVLGQTSTTDAIAGGHAIGREHRQVQEDIERADAKALAAVLNRDLVRPWIDLQFGPQEKYPRLTIGRAEQKDVKGIIDMVARLVPMGIKVGKKQMRDLVGLGEPDTDDELLTPATITQRYVKEDGDIPEMPPEPTDPALNAEGSRKLPQDVVADDATAAAGAAVAALVAKFKAMADSASSLEELQAMIAEGGTGDLADLELAMKQALLVSHLTGQSEIA